MPFVSPEAEPTSRKLRHRDTRRKLSSILFESLGRLKGVSVVGSDPLVAYFANSLELEPASLAACQAMLDDRPVTLVGVPSRLWYRPQAMERLLRMKAAMEKCGRSCILLPQRAIAMLDRGDTRQERARMLIELIRDPVGMGIDRACCNQRPGDPIGCRAMQLLTGNDCSA
ncbi:MAG: hypothetical protein KJ944_10020 [Alphaproteobacteria bacterium]|nr:hypothetical protein [Alphaproteobacteria bacterium]MBU1560714.1 hypothetical protein [Alphaproteobacteria bacterium]MBU2302923.1 hypothetical protein [Alphaproteobacteria bacterium]MBU2367650.1 hypothetical protein [Alphaproteobacteria bacterium]